jgi:hypothetical protein
MARVEGARTGSSVSFDFEAGGIGELYLLI